jgi:multiple sugar transport system substrate-binding protein|tara:strand:- start:5133 stop:6557 length:1425 start_codon:yes stop_codon:yes gene_type:complete
MKKIYALTAVAVITFGTTSWGDGFTLDDIPEIGNKKAINVALEAGGGADLIIPFLEAFSKKTGVPVTHESMVFATLYSKEIIELQSGTGAYDLVVTETSWTNEWQDYLAPMETLANTYDPEGIEGFKEYAQGHDSGILRMASTRDGVLVGAPYYTYTMLNIFRDDLMSDEGERNAFKAKFGYDLAAPTSNQQLMDMAQFFTRGAGEKLKGVELEKPFYGVSLMAGRYPHVQDEVSAILWGTDGRWARTIRDASGAVTGFEITEEDMIKLENAFQFYRDLMQFAPPGSENAFWDFATAQFVDGNTAMIPYMYSPLWNWSTDVINVGGKNGGAPVPGSRPYTGAFHFAPSKDSENLEAAYWLLKYIGSEKTQTEMVNSGWSSARRDSIENCDTSNDNAHRNCGWINSLTTQWDAQASDVESYLHFNSKAFGKLYEQMTIIAHENAVGMKTPAQSVKAWRKAFGRYQKKFDDVSVKN